MEEAAKTDRCRVLSYFGVCLDGLVQCCYTPSCMCGQMMVEDKSVFIIKFLPHLWWL